jgi:hypothetical protein
VLENSNMNIFIQYYLPDYINQDKMEKTYIIPTWQEVHPKTTLNDVEWIKPEIGDKPEIKGVWEFESDSSKGKFYSVKQNGLKLTCNCSRILES